MTSYHKNPDIAFSDKSSSFNSEPLYSEMNHRAHRTLELPTRPSLSIRQSLLNPSHFSCDGCSELSQAHFVVRCHCSKISSSSCFYLRNSCTYCGAIFGDNTVFEKTTFYDILLHHTCHLESRSKKLTFLNMETINQTTDIGKTCMVKKMPGNFKFSRFDSCFL